MTPADADVFKINEGEAVWFVLLAQQLNIFVLLPLLLRNRPGISDVCRQLFEKSSYIDEYFVNDKMGIFILTWNGIIIKN